VSSIEPFMARALPLGCRLDTSKPVDERSVPGLPASHACNNDQVKSIVND
jgi:hypothetical protein